ncbi:MAG: hypothetical protein ABIQ64_00100 [Candidatus Saccharimonadales bacterium]
MPGTPLSLRQRGVPAGKYASDGLTGVLLRQCLELGSSVQVRLRVVADARQGRHSRAVRLPGQGGDLLKAVEPPQLGDEFFVAFFRREIRHVEHEHGGGFGDAVRHLQHRFRGRHDDPNTGAEHMRHSPWWCARYTRVNSNNKC